MLTMGGCHVSSALRAIVAIAFASVVSACGGGGNGAAATGVPPQPSSGVSIVEGSGVVAVSLGDERQQLFALPSEVTERVLHVQKNDRSLLLDVSVTRGAEAVSVRQESGRLVVTVNSTTLRAGDAIPYTVTVRNRATGTGAEVNGTVQVLTPVTVASGQVTAAGGVIENRAANVRIEFDPKPGAVPLNVAVNVADQSDGQRQIRIVFDRDISSDDRVIRISPPSSFANSPQAKILSTGRERIASQHTLPLRRPYLGNFTIFGGFRFEAGPLSLAVMAASCVTTPVGPVLYVCYSERPAAELRGPQQSVGEPVLFVHGYTSGDSLGGGDGTWGNFFSLVTQLNAVPFEFQWRTNARFQTVADDLARAILEIRATSGDRKITVVAHSFGGVLVRSLLQHLGTDKNTDWSQHIRQVITLGTPHSGIFDETTQRGLFSFPNGQDNLAFEGCDQISCHQVGENVFSYFPATLQLVALTGVNLAPGEVAAMLANLDANALPRGVPFSVGIGLAVDLRLSFLNNIVGTIYRNGDALISLQGQRFTPRLLGTTGNWSGDLSYLQCATVFGPHVEEIILGSDGRFPGQSFALPVIQNGYGHNNFSIGLAGANLSANLQEANVGCTTTSCGHASFQLVRRALEHGVCYPTITRDPETVWTDNGTASFTVTASGNPPLTYQWRINGVDIVVDGSGRSTQCGTGFLAAGINTATLSLSGLPAGCSSTNFTVVVGSGPLLTTSALATLFVGVPPTPPTITDQPRDAVAVSGGSASFAVTATTTACCGLSYQWRLGALALRDDQSIDCGGSRGGTGVVVSGATTRTLTLSNIPLVCNGERLFVEVINGPAGGTGLTATSQSATLTVSGTPPPPAAPAVSAINPTAMVANGLSQTLTISGNGFTSANIVQFRWGVGAGAGVWNNSASPISSLTAPQISVPMNPGTVADTINVRVCRSISQTTAGDCSSGAVSVTVSPAVANSPDLVVQSVTFGPTAVAPSATVQVVFAISNLGTATANASTAAIRINESGTSPVGTTFGTVSVSALTAGASTALLTANVIVPATPGTYTVWVVADSSGTAGQASGATANDGRAAVATLTINSIPAGPVVSSITSSPLNLVIGGPAAFSVNGTGLQPGLLFSLPGCNATEVGSASTTLRQFTCTLTQAGANLSGSVSTLAGTVLRSFIQTVAANPVAAGPGGLYVGYYAEDPVTNPEDPTIGGLFFSLPASNGNFAGAMYFTFAGCQSNNVGALSGTKDASGMTGAWSGVVDGILQSGAYAGVFGSALGAYAGTYTVSGGKQLVNVPGCIQYYVAPHGTWEAMPVGSSVPSTFTLTVSGASVSWINPVGTIITWVSVIDQAEASAGVATAVRYQTGSAVGPPTFNLEAVSGLTSGRTYVVTVTTATADSQRTGVASVQVVR